LILDTKHNMDTMVHRQKQETDDNTATTVDSAHPSSNGSRNDEDSSMANASQDSTGSDGGESSSSEESDDSTSDEGESESDDIATVKPGSKPNFSARVASGAPSLEDRLKSFLPQLAEANNKLQQDGVNGFSMEDVKEDEPHIEMNLGLGVLKEMNGKDGEEGADSSEDEEEDGDATASPERKRREKDIMGKLMGGRKNEAAGIEEVG
jgi:hypothetical protein